MTVTGYWLERAACIGVDPEAFAARTPQGQQRAIDDHCRRCPVDAECLADALDLPADQDHGVRGGMSRQQRLRLRKRTDLPTGRSPVTIAALRQLLDQEQPDVPRHRAPRTPRRAPRTPRRAAREKTKVYEKPETTQAATEPEQPPTEPAAATPVRSISDLLDWAEQHTEAAMRKHAATARQALAVIQQRHAADSELARVTSEADELRQRLAELDARAKELTSAGKAKRDYDPATVRAWAQQAGVTCPAFGVVPKAVVAAWRERDAA